MNFVFTPSLVAAGLIVAAFAVTANDSAGVAHSLTFDASTLVAQPDGTLLASVSFPDGEIPTGGLVGAIKAITADGTAVGGPFSFNGTVPAVVPPPTPVNNMQPQPTGVSFTYA